MLSKIALILCMTVGATALANEINKEAVATIEITRYLEDWSKKRAPKYRRKMLSYIPSAAHWATHYQIDPLLVAVVISCESSWRATTLGGLKEVGLMQVHSRPAKRGFDLSDPHEQIQAGVRWLGISIDTCGGSIPRGLNMYSTGSCRKTWSGLRKRLRRWRMAIRLFRSTDGT